MKQQKINIPKATKVIMDYLKANLLPVSVVDKREIMKILKEARAWEK
jgi:hypothetical protein